MDSGRTKIFQITAEAETQTGGYPANGATITAIVAGKNAFGTAMAATLTAQPSETPLPAVPADSPDCRPESFKTSFGSNGATGSITLNAGLTNIGAEPCFLQAWPQVVLADRRGKPLDADYGYFDLSAGDAASAATAHSRESETAKIGVLPGWTASLFLIWQNWCGGDIPGGAIIRLTLIHNLGTIEISTDLESGGRCDAPGYRSYVGISKFGPASPPQ
jgi:hypothetical protein